MFIRVDSELATKTKTSASRQNLSIQLSNSVVTSVPGLWKRFIKLPRSVTNYFQFRKMGTVRGTQAQ